MTDVSTLLKPVIYLSNLSKPHKTLHTIKPVPKPVLRSLRPIRPVHRPVPGNIDTAAYYYARVFFLNLFGLKYKGEKF